MNIKPIKTEQDYKQALTRLELIFDALPNTADGDELEALGVLIGNYENTFSAIDMPDPIKAIKFRTEQIRQPQAWTYAEKMRALKKWIENSVIVSIY